MDNQAEHIESGTVLPEALSILVVDKKDSAQVLERNISGLGYRHQAARSYSGALKKIVNHKFDLVFIDINIPEGDWIATVTKIREAEGEIDIVTMADENSREIEQEVRDQKVTYYILKPVEYHEIKSILDHISKKKNRTNKR